MTLKINRAPLQNHIKLCVSFRHHMWNQTGVMVPKRLIWVMTSITLTFDFWPWTFAYTSILSLVITPENFMIIYDGDIVKNVWKAQTDRQTDRPVRQTDRRTDGRTDRQKDRQYFLKENPFENVICKMLAIFSGLKMGLFDAYFFIKVYN